jgi:hypothetical protein
MCLTFLPTIVSEAYDPPKKSTKISMSVFPRLFSVLSRFRVFLTDVSSKTQQKTFCKQIVSKSFCKKSTKNPKLIFPGFLFITVLGVFSGSKNTRKKYEEDISPAPVLFTQGLLKTPVSKPFIYTTGDWLIPGFSRPTAEKERRAGGGSGFLGSWVGGPKTSAILTLVH